MREELGDLGKRVDENEIKEQLERFDGAIGRVRVEGVRLRCTCCLCHVRMLYLPNKVEKLLRVRSSWGVAFREGGDGAGLSSPSDVVGAPFERHICQRWSLPHIRGFLRHATPWLFDGLQRTVGIIPSLLGPQHLGP